MAHKTDVLQAVANAVESSKGQELFGNWELSDELDDEDLSVIVGGAEVKGEVRVVTSIIQGGAAATLGVTYFAE